MKGLAVMLLCTAIAAVASDRRADKTDAAIEKRVTEYLSRHAEFRNVTHAVDDAVVTLSGYVETASERMSLESDLRKVRRVAAVHNFVILNPAPETDEILIERLRQRLAAGNLSELQVEVHDARAVVSGSVHTRREWSHAVNLAWTTPGIREVECNIRVQEGN